MKLTPIQLIPLFAISLLILSCSEATIQGHWKLREVDVMDVPSQSKRMTLDLSNPGKMKADLYEQSLPKEHDQKTNVNNTSTEEMDSLDVTGSMSKIKADIDKWVASAVNTSMKLEHDNRFYMKSNGMIVPTVVPGWHFGDTLEGKWRRNKDTLFLSVGDRQQAYSLKFKIIQLTNKKLELQEMFDGFEGKGNDASSVNNILPTSLNHNILL